MTYVIMSLYLILAITFITIAERAGSKFNYHLRDMRHSVNVFEFKTAKFLMRLSALEWSSYMLVAAYFLYLLYTKVQGI